MIFIAQVFEFVKEIEDGYLFENNEREELTAEQAPSVVTRCQGQTPVGGRRRLPLQRVPGL